MTFFGEWLSARLPAAWREPSFQAGFPAWFAWWFHVLRYAMAGALLVLLYALITTPSRERLERWAPRLMTRVFDREGRPLAEFGRARRLHLALDSAPAPLVDALVSIEDREFWTHGGVDLGALPAALLPALWGERARGASTLTQQLAKNAFLGPERSLLRKLREFIIAYRLESVYTKREVLELYLNTVYLGGGVQGFADAAPRYFGRPLAALSVGEWACLAGLLRKPESLRPDRHPAEAQARRNVVLRAMTENGKLAPAVAESLAREPLRLKPQPPRFLPDMAPLVSDRLHEAIDSAFGPGFADSAGATVITTLDNRVQALADSIVRFHVDTLQRRHDRVTIWGCRMPALLHLSEERLLAEMDALWPRFDSLHLRGVGPGAEAKARRLCPEVLRRRKIEAAVVVLDTRTGAVRAQIGGLRPQRGGYDRSVQARRSPGSSFKAMVYAAAIERGASPADMIDDAPLSLPDPDDSTSTWRPHNLEYDYDGRETYRRALYRSRNLPAVRVALKTGLDTVIETARRLGLEGGMRNVPSLALGGLETQVWEMAAAFRAIANQGRYAPPTYLARAVDRHGQEMALPTQVESQALRPQTAFILCDMLRDVNIRGTAAEVWAQGFTYPSGGKTGTSNDHRDAWYVGFTPLYTAAVWLGNDDFMPLDGHFTGTDAAMPIWRDLMLPLHRGQPRQDFVPPEGLTHVSICKRSGLAAGAACDSVAYDWQVQGFPKRAACTPTLHAQALATLPQPVHRVKPEADSSSGFGDFLRNLLNP